MSYQPGIPNANDAFPQSQQDIQTNFTSLNTSFNSNHIALNAAADRGKHRAVQFVEGAASATAVNEIGLYAADTGTQPDLFVRPQSNGTAQRLTGGGLTAAAYCVFNGAGGIFANSFNIASVVRNGLGDYTISFTRNFINATDYVVLVTAHIATIAIPIGLRSLTKLANSSRITTGSTGTGAFLDPTLVHCVFFGLLV